MENINYKTILFGGDYNPEQWLFNPDITERDLELMKQANVNVATIGIFSWGLIEKEEGVYDFSFLDMIMDKLAQNNIGAILATPSAAMPNWLAKKYPDVLRTDENNIKKQQPMRSDYCPISPIYREKVRAVNTKLAERYANHPALTMWHISNEYYGGCHCARCADTFREYLKKRYDNNLELLNQKLWTAFWSNTYSSWDEIDPPAPSGRSYKSGLYLEWKRFVTDITIDFFNNEAEVLRRKTPNIPITTNFHGDLSDIDYWRFKDYVDVISWDIYPKWHSRDDSATSDEAAFIYDICRSMKKSPFLIMENTPGAISSPFINKAKAPGMNELSALHAVAHGANMIGFFQWRKSLGGFEKMHGAVIDHSGRADTRIYKEVQKLGHKLSELADICETNVSSDTAVIYDWECRWTLDNIYGYNGSDKKYKEVCLKHCSYFYKHGISVDVINQMCDFSKYKIVIAPMLYLCHGETIDRLKDFVSNGGILVSTYISGICDDYDLCYFGGFPGGDLKELFGIWAEETYVLNENETQTVKVNEKTYSAIDFYESIHTDTAHAIAEYDSGYLINTPAATENDYGKGKAFYIGFRDDGSFIGALYDKITQNISKYTLPNGIRISKRSNNKDTYIFIQNFNEHETTVSLPNNYAESDTSDSKQKISLSAYETTIIKKRSKTDERI